MGEYAEIYTLETFGIDISTPDRKVKPALKWACPICRKNLPSEVAQNQHIAMKHKKRIAVQEQDAPKKIKKEMIWECNECGSQEYTMSVSESDVNELGCGNCGGYEWHKALKK